MAIPRCQFMRNFCECVARDLSLCQTFLLLLWLLALLLQKFAGAALGLLEGWFFDSLANDGTGSSTNPSSDDDRFGATVDDDQAGAPLIESSDFTNHSGSLIPSLPDVIVQKYVWPRLVDPPLLPLLCQLRNVNLSWRRFLSTTVEWSTLMFLHLTCLDTMVALF